MNRRLAAAPASIFLAAFSLLLPTGAVADPGDPQRTKKAPVESGACRSGDRVFEASRAECRRRKGTFFATLEEASGTAAPAQKSPARTGSERPARTPPPPPGPGDREPLLAPDFVDLTITDVTITPVSPRIAADLITIRTTIKNKGVSTPQSDAFLQIELTDDPYTRYLRWVVAPYSLTLPRLAPNTEHVVTKTVRIPRQFKDGANQTIVPQPGRYKVRASIDTTTFGVDGEHDRDNNAMTKTFVVRDPVPSNLVLDRISLTTGCRIKIRFHNEAAAIPAEDFDAAWVSVQEGDGLRQQERLRDVDAAGVSKKAGFAWVPGQGAVQYVWPTPHDNPALDIGLAPGETVSVTVELDPYHAIRDEKPADNRRTRTLSCP